VGHFRTNCQVRVLVLGHEHESSKPRPESVAAILGDLGCRVSAARLDLGDIDLDELAARPPAILVIDAGDDLPMARGCLKKLSDFEFLSEVPTLLVVTVPRLSGLDFALGFDDFVLSPVVPAELHARLRQLDWRSAAFGSEEIIKAGDLVIDAAGYEVYLHGRRLSFTHQEFELLKFLARNRGRAYTREQLLRRAWGYAYAGTTRTVDIHVRRLRAKLGATSGGLIETVRNVGYKMRAARGTGEE
jgi:DNA-binding response OmpR family regulator